MDLERIYRARVADGTFRADEAQAAVVPLLARVGMDANARPKKNFFGRIKPEPVRGLYLWGGVGRGKSMLMDLFVDTLDIPVRRVHFHAFMQEIHTGMHAARKTGVEDALAPVAETVARDLRVLAFDEMQVTDITDAMIVGRLFEMLFAAGIAIVVTSNRVPDDLYKDGLNRQLFLPFIDLLKTRMEVHEIVSATDYRQDRLSGSPVYFAPNDAKARAAVDTIWTDLGSGAEPLHLNVKSRIVTLPQFASGVARVGFHDLCGQPLGPADYLAVAEACRVLILEDIPLLGRMNFNEAKRFVTLIDTLYEARVRLIATAAAMPEMLYVEGEGSFEFERTASRLTEMQSADWAS